MSIPTSSSRPPSPPTTDHMRHYLPGAQIPERLSYFLLNQLQEPLPPTNPTDPLFGVDRVEEAIVYERIFSKVSDIVEQYAPHYIPNMQGVRMTIALQNPLLQDNKKFHFIMAIVYPLRIDINE